MKGHDGRSLRVAVISDGLLNGADAPIAADVAERGWGLAWLPPAALGDADAAAWIENIADLVRELRRHDLTAVALLASDEPRELLLLRTFGDELGLPVIPRADEDPRATLAELDRHAEGTARPPSWLAAPHVPTTGETH